MTLQLLAAKDWEPTQLTPIHRPCHRRGKMQCFPLCMLKYCRYGMEKCVRHSALSWAVLLPGTGPSCQQSAVALDDASWALKQNYMACEAGICTALSDVGCPQEATRVTAHRPDVQTFAQGA